MAVRTALTTGANSGIGLATTIELARRGLHSVGTVRTDAKAQVLHDAAAAAGVTVEHRILDVTDADGCAHVVHDVTPDVLVNNAGYSVTGAIEDVDDDEARDALETMVVAPMRLARLAIPHMREQRFGRIVNVSSIYGRTATPLTGWYQGAKHALEGLSDALRMEVARDGIAVVVVEPGGFRTGIWEETEREVAKRSGSRYGPSYARTLQATRLGRPFMGAPETCAKAIAKAATARVPAPRYLVGLDARAIALWSSLTPTRVKDEVTRRVLNL